MKLLFTQRIPALALVLAALAYVSPVLSDGPTYFYITKPAAGDQWTQGTPHATNWIHSNDGIDIVDVELARKSSSGLLLAAREVPTRWGSSNLLLDSVPPGDDYYFVFMNVTHGVVYSISSQFTILPASGSSANSSAQLAPDPAKPTVTVTGAPGPFMTFAQTFGPQAAGAVSILGSLASGRTTLVLASAVAASLLGGTLLAL